MRQNDKSKYKWNEMMTIHVIKLVDVDVSKKLVVVVPKLLLQIVDYIFVHLKSFGQNF